MRGKPIYWQLALVLLLVLISAWLSLFRNHATGDGWDPMANEIHL